MAERSALSARTISDLERGLRRTPHLETVRMIADGLRLTDAERASLFAAARPELSASPPERSTGEITHIGKPIAPLPRPRGPLNGREPASAYLVAQLSSRTTRLITLTGPGGVGKTRLALEVANQIGPAFAGGATFVPLAHVRDPDLVIPTIARALGVNESGDQPLINRVCAVLSNRTTLLVLDNMEQITAAATDVAALLAGVPDLSVLVTSRGALILSGERRYPVRVLSLPDPGNPEPLESIAASEAVALFIDRAQMVHPDFALTPANAPAIAEICHRLDGLPLAIELAAARISLLPPAALLTRMERRLPLLTGGARDLPARLQTMRAAIAWSYDLLSPEEQATFRRLAVFMGGFTLEAAEAVMVVGVDERIILDATKHPLDRVAALIERGLVWQAEQPDGDARFGMLETIREFGLEQLAISGEEGTIRQAHAAWFLSLAESLEAGGRAKAASSLDRIERELPNFRIALSWTTGAERLDLAQSLSYLWGLRSHRTEGRNWIESALACAPHLSPAVRSVALKSLSFLEHSIGNRELGISYMNQSLALAREQDDRCGVIFALHQLAEYAVDAGDDEEALSVLAELETWGTDPGDHADALAEASIHRGVIARRRRHLPRAKDYFTESTTRFDGSNDIYGRAIARELLGLVQCDCGTFALAANSFLASLDDWRTLGTRESLIDWLAMVATLAEATGEPVRACRWFGAVEAHAQTLGFNFPLPERLEFARTAERVRTGPADQNWSSGRALSLDRVTEEAADWLRTISTSEKPAIHPSRSC
jgi:predicted ATPase